MFCPLVEYWIRCSGLEVMSGSFILIVPFGWPFRNMFQLGRQLFHIGKLAVVIALDSNYAFNLVTSICLLLITLDSNYALDLVTSICLLLLRKLNYDLRGYISPIWFSFFNGRIYSWLILVKVTVILIQKTFPWSIP